MMKKMTVLLFAAVMLFISSGCMYSKTFIVEDMGSTAKSQEIVNNAQMINSSTHLIEYIGLDSRDRLISLNCNGEEYSISAARVTDPSLQKTLLTMENIDDAAIANHGENIVFTSKIDDIITLYSYSVNSGNLISLCSDNVKTVVSDLYAAPAIESVAHVVMDNDEMYIENFHLMSGMCTQYSVRDTSMKKALQYIAGSMHIDGIFVEDNSRVTLKATTDSGAFIISAVCNEYTDDIITIDSSTTMPQIHGNFMFYVNKRNELMMINIDSKIERKIADNVKKFAVAADASTIAFITSENGMDMLYAMDNENSKAKLIDIRKGISNIELSIDGKYMMISYDIVNEDSLDKDSLIYTLYE